MPRKQLPVMLVQIMTKEAGQDALDIYGEKEPSEANAWRERTAPHSVAAEKLFDKVPKRRWADIAFQLALRLQGEDDALEALKMLQDEDKALTNWGF